METPNQETVVEQEKCPNCSSFVEDWFRGKDFHYELGVLCVKCGYKKTLESG